MISWLIITIMQSESIFFLLSVVIPIFFVCAIMILNQSGRAFMCSERLNPIIKHSCAKLDLWLVCNQLIFHDIPESMNLCFFSGLYVNPARIDMLETQ